MNTQLSSIFSLISIPQLVLILIVEVLIIVSRWRLFEKAGEKGWKAIIPFYSSYIQYELYWGSGILFLLGLLPIIGLVFGIILTVKEAKSYGKSGGYAVLMLFLSFIFYPMLAFGDSQYIGPNGERTEQPVRPQYSNMAIAVLLTTIVVIIETLLGDIATVTVFKALGLTSDLGTANRITENANKDSSTIKVQPTESAEPEESEEPTEDADLDTDDDYSYNDTDTDEYTDDSDTANPVSGESYQVIYNKYTKKIDDLVNDAESKIYLLDGESQDRKDEFTQKLYDNINELTEQGSQEMTDLSINSGDTSSVFTDWSSKLGDYGVQKYTEVNNQVNP